jgi:hypothetical protein
LFAQRRVEEEAAKVLKELQTQFDKDLSAIEECREKVQKLLLLL